MRLTLRTLLSWKDGMLEPEAARDLGAKVESSDKAAELVARITEVVGRPTLTGAAPDADGFAAAANTTAEYLDNVLPPEQLEKFERLCLASEAQLAEAAACHEMLAAWSREPAPPLDRRSRNRLLAAVRSRIGGGEPATVPAPRIAAPARRPKTPPPRPARAPTSAWLLVATAVALLVVLAGVLGWSLTARSRKAAPAAVATGQAEPRDPVADAAPPAAAAVAADDIPPAAAVVAAGGAAPVPPPPPVAAAAADMRDEPAAAAPAAAEPVIADAPPTPAIDAAPVPAVAAAADPVTRPTEEPPAPAPPAAAAGAAPPAAVPPRVPSGDAMAIAAPPVPTANGAAAAVAPPAADAAAAAAPARVMGPGVLLHRSQGGGPYAWTAVVDGGPLELPADLVALPFAGVTLAVDDARIALEPGTRGVLSRDADGTPRLEVVFGAASVAGGGRLGITTGDFRGVVVAGLATPVGVEVRMPRQPGATAEETQRVARVFPSVGALELRTPDADGEPMAVPKGMALVWRSTTPGAVALEPAAATPDWLTDRRTGDRVDGLAARALESRLAAGTLAVPALRELAADRRVEARVAAAATLAVLGEFAAAARLITADGAAALPETLWSRLDAVAVQPALARGPRATEALAQAFADQGPPAAADTLLRFARGFTDQELAAGAAAELVAELESPHLAVRRYAIRNLVEITGADAVDRQRYRADRPAAALREDAAWWRARLEQGRIVRTVEGGASR